MNKPIDEHYRELLFEHGDTHRSAQYSSRESQEMRFEILSHVSDLRESSILDWGCGSGHLATWLAERDINVSYTGVDVVEEFLELGRQKHPGHRFGLISDFEGEVFDWIIVSGTFNNRVGDNDRFFRESVRDLWSRCSRGIAFNLMSKWVDYEEPDLWYASPEETFAFMKGVTPFVTLRNDYVVKAASIPFEFAVYAYRCAEGP